MLRSRDEISEDKSFGPLTEAILERDQPRTTDLFFRMVAREGRSIGEALSRGHRGRGAVRPGAEPHQRQGRPDLADQQRPHDPRPARLGLSDAVSAGEIPAAAAAAERLVHPGRARHLEPAGRQIPRPLRDDEGHERAAAELWPGGVARGPRADPRGWHGRGAAACADDRHGQRRFAALLRPVPRPGRGRADCARCCATRSNFSA